MKEQWKKLDNDAKLLVDVEEGNHMPIKINIPLSALTPPRDEFCCNRLLTVLRVCMLLTLLTLLGWAATTLYCNYYDKAIPLHEESLENKFAFQSLVFKNKDAFEADDQFKKSDSEAEAFRDSTKKALDQIVVEMKDVNEKLDQLQEKEQLQIEIKTIPDDAKLTDDEIVTSERSDQTLDSMLDELAKEVGLAENQLSDKAHLENKPELAAIVISEPQDEDFNSLQKVFDQLKMGPPLLKKLNSEESMAPKIPENIDESPEELSAYQTELFGDFSYEPSRLYGEFWKEELNPKSELDAIIRNRVSVENGNINRMVTSNLDINSEQQYEKEDKVKNDVMEEQDENAEESFVDGLVNGFIDTFLGDSIEKEVKENDSSKHSDDENVEESPNEDKVEEEMIEQREQDEMVKQIISESLLDKVIHEMMEGETNMKDGSTEDGSSPSQFEEIVNLIVNDDEGKKENLATISEEKYDDDSLSIPFLIDPRQFIETEFASEDKYSPSLEGLFDFMVNDGEDKKENLRTISEEKNEYVPLSTGYIPIQMTYPDPRFSRIFDEETASDFHQFFLPKVDSEEPNVFSENKEMNINEKVSIQEDSSTKQTLIEMVPSVEYVKKIEENPFIPRVAKMLEPIVGQNHELLIWYYAHKDLPDFLRGADKWKVFGAKLLYDSNIKDYPADATIISGLTFEKVYSGAEYPSSSEEIKSDLQQEIINRLILKSYLNKMLLEGNAESEILSQVIEQHNLEKLKELDIDPQQLTYIGDFFEVDEKDKDDFMIPVVQFDPFVDESREANEQRAQVIKAFERTRNSEDNKLRNGFFDSITSVASEQAEQSELLATVIPEETKDSEDSRQLSEIVTSEALPETSEVSLGLSDDYVSDESSETVDDWLTEFIPKDGPIRFRRSLHSV